MSRRTRVYIAGPMTNGNGRHYDVTSIRDAILTHHRLATLGYAPLCPHLSILAEIVSPSTSWDTWLDVDKSWVGVADAVLRLPGPSKGADCEVAHAEHHGIPVFFSVADLFDSVDPTLLESDDFDDQCPLY